MHSRIRAFLVHLGASAIVALITIAIVFFVWYPAPLHKAIGVTQIFLLILMVDVIIGPLMTLVVYKTDKKKLLFDLSVIIALQLGAYLYGIHTVAVGRPAWLVFENDHFSTVRPADITEITPDTPEEYRRFPLSGPRWAAAQSPKGDEQRAAFELSEMIDGITLAQRTDLYAPLETERKNIVAGGRPMEELLKYNAEAAVNEVKQKWPQAHAWLPLQTNNIPMVVLMEKDKVEPLAIVDLRPWK